MRGFSVSIYALFFVLVGARLSLREMPGWLIAMVAAYVLMRCAGKALGAYLGARATGAEPVVRRYLGLGLFAQGGVAVGLSIMAGQHLSDIPLGDGLTLGDAIIFGITTTTLLVQVIGPACVKLAVQRAGEAGRNVTEEDVIGSLTAADVMFTDIVTIHEEEPLDQVVRRFAEHDHLVYPVVDKDDQLLGMVSLTELREILTDQAAWSWLVASDVVRPVTDHAFPHTPLNEALATMQQVQLDQMPVLDNTRGLHPVGLLDTTHIRSRVEREILLRQGRLPAGA
jgi:CBS domain-containing protein